MNAYENINFRYYYLFWSAEMYDHNKIQNARYEIIVPEIMNVEQGNG